MGRRAGFVTAVAAIALAGCLDEKFARFTSKQVNVPATSEASMETAARVDLVGRQLVTQTPFLGVEPTFHTIGRKEPEIHHPDLTGVFITEGLVKRCPSDAELAAVLASELGKMAAEKRATDRMRLPDPLPALPDAGGTGLGGDPTQLAVQSVIDGKTGRPGKDRKPATEDPRTIAEEVLRSAGFQPKALDAVAPLLQEARRNHQIADQLSGQGKQPQWSP